MIQYNEIKEVHLELSSNCNAACPVCPRNMGGYAYNAGYPVTSLSLADIKKIFTPDFLSQLLTIIVNGNYGDFVTVQDALETIEYLHTHSEANIIISTNGSARTAKFWRQLATYNPIVIFGIDGLADTHALHRRSTNFDLVLKNASSFISAGGTAVWKMIRFDHNQHQIDECRILAEQMGFKEFELITDGRHNSIVFDNDGNFSYTIGTVQHIPETAVQLIQWLDDNNDNKIHYKLPIHNKISCESTNKKSIYVATNGEIYPCCYLGFYPKTYSSSIIQGNDQIKELLNGVEHNALIKPLAECVEWFNLVEQTWTKPTFEDGKLWRCNQMCGTS